jgi:Squalene-hopene cyclase C-terminal domain
MTQNRTLRWFRIFGFRSLGFVWVLMLGICDFWLWPFWSGAEAADQPSSPEARALAYLAREVPRWKTENKCYSCHNNGDAGRALYVARRRGRAVADEALQDTSRWLTQTADWDKKPDGERGQDTGLARLQFAAALVEAIDAGLVKDEKALGRAAVLVAEGQHKDGSWPVSNADTIGGPTTYGPTLATWQARRVLLKADKDKYRDALARADRWLHAREVKNILDAAALLLCLEGNTTAEAQKQRDHCLSLIRKGEAKDGGWGPYATSPPEVFDTALVLLALRSGADTEEGRGMVKRGRAFLIASQEKDGSWPETTRPTGGTSYAQRLSTAGWATLALIATAAK